MLFNNKVKVNHNNIAVVCVVCIVRLNRIFLQICYITEDVH